MESFFQNASMFFTAAKANILAGVAQIKDDTGIEQLPISNEFDTINANFVTTMRRCSQVLETFKALNEKLLDLSKSFTNVSLSFEKCFSFCSGDCITNLNSLKTASFCVSQLTEITVKSKIVNNIMKPYQLIYHEGYPLYEIRNTIKSSFSIYQQYKKEYDYTFSIDAAAPIVENNRQEKEKYQQKYESNYAIFRDKGRALYERLKEMDKQLLDIYDQIEREYFQEMKRIFDELNAEDPKDFELDIPFTNYSDEEPINKEENENTENLTLTQPNNNSSQILNVPIELDSDMPSLE